MLYLLAIIIWSSFAYLCWRNFKLGLAVLIGLLPLYLIRFQIGPLPTTLLELLVVTTILVWLGRYQTWRLDILKYQQWLWPLGLLLLAGVIGIIVAPDTWSALGIFKAYLAEPAILFLVLVTTFKNQSDWLLAFKALAVSAIFLSLLALVQAVTGLGIPVPWDLERRVTSVFDYPNALGLFLAPIVGLTAILHSQTKEKIWLSSALLGALAIMLAETEAAYVAIPAGLLLTFLVSNTTRASKVKIVGAVAIVSLVALIGSTTIRSKLLLQDYSGQVRLSQWSETWQLLQDRPIFGAGLNGYPEVFAAYHDPTLYEIFQYPHNLILNTWVELGLLGLVAMFWLGWLVLKNQQTKKDNFIVLVAFAGLSIMVIHGLVDVPFFKNDLAVMTAFLLAAIAQMQNRATKW